MMIRILLWAVLIGSVIMGIVGVQTGSVTNAAIGIGILIIGAFVLFFLLKMFIHFGFFMVKILLIIGLIALIAVAGLKGCQYMIGGDGSRPPQTPQTVEAEVVTFNEEIEPQKSLIQKARQIFGFGRSKTTTSHAIQKRGQVLALPSGISGRVTSVRSGYLFKVGNHFVKLYGIDAPDPKQECRDRRNTAYDCGKKSKQMLERLILKENLFCRVAGGDFRQNVIATCKIRDTDVGAAMVLAGWAVADRSETDVYIPYEEQANHNRQGLWAGRFVAPWQARAHRGKQSAPQPKAKAGFWESLF